jgi:hypothetical protein
VPVVAAIAPIIIALMALLLIYGSAQLGKVLANIFPKSIGVGIASIHPRAWVEAGINAVLAGVTWIVGDVIRPLVGLFVRPVAAVLSWANELSSFALSSAQAIDWIINDGVPQAVSAVKSYAARAVSAARAYALSLYHQARTYAASLYHQARSYALSLYHSAESYALSLYHKAETYAHGLYAAALARVSAALASAEAYTRAYVKATDATISKAVAAATALAKANLTVAEKYTDASVASAVKALNTTTAAAISSAIHVVDTTAVAGLHTVWPDVLDGIDALEGVIGTDLPDIGAAVRAIPRAIPTDLADAIPLIGAISIPMLRYMTRCGVPNCRNLSKIGRDLQDLFGAIEGVGFLALITYMVTNPRGASDEANTVLTPLASGLIHSARDLIGV